MNARRGKILLDAREERGPCWRITKELVEVAFTLSLKAGFLSWMASGGL